MKFPSHWKRGDHCGFWRRALRKRHRTTSGQRALISRLLALSFSSASLVNIHEAWLRGGEEKLEAQTEWWTEMVDEWAWVSELEDSLTGPHKIEHAWGSHPWTKTNIIRKGEKKQTRKRDHRLQQNISTGHCYNVQPTTQKPHFFNRTLAISSLSTPFIVKPLGYHILLSIKLSQEQSLRSVEHRNRALVILKIASWLQLCFSPRPMKS